MQVTVSPSTVSTMLTWPCHVLEPRGHTATSPGRTSSSLTLVPHVSQARAIRLMLVGGMGRPAAFAAEQQAAEHQLVSSSTTSGCPASLKYPIITSLCFLPANSATPILACITSSIVGIAHYPVRSYAAFGR